MESKNKIKVFISQPMKDKTEKEIFEKRGEIKEYQYARGCYIEYLCAQRYHKTIIMET